ncbi:MAG: hypothetical protein R3179_01145 [Sedimenticolaceae bacterium]|nr:hypothetical protein [Sedimenticolaceae bacterium]
MPEDGTPRDRPHGFKQAMAQAPLAVPLVVTEFSSRGEFDRPLSPGGLSCVEAKPFTGSVEKDLMAQRGVDKHDR